MAMNYREGPQRFPEEAATEQTRNQELLKQAIEEYKRGPVTPDVVTNYWKAKLPDLAIPACDWSPEQVQAPMKDIKGNDVPGILVPDTDKISLPLLGRRYPSMVSYSVREDTPVTDTHETRGYVKVYAAIDSPNRVTTQSQLEKFAEKEGYLGQRLRTYILTSQASKDLTGKYFDEGDTSSRLLGSRDGGSVIDARFRRNGYLTVHWDLRPDAHGPDLGGRFEEVKKA